MHGELSAKSEFLKCVGYFCGRLPNGTHCLSCPWGSRVHPDNWSVEGDICWPCLDPPSTHDWLYLGFLWLLPVIVFFFFTSNEATFSPSTRLYRHCAFFHVQTSDHQSKQIGSNSSRFRKHTWLFGLCCIIIHFCAGLLSILIFPPAGRFDLNTCRPRNLNDFYPTLVADYGCLYEVAFPYTSLPLVYFIISAIFAVAVYSLFLSLVNPPRNWFRTYYFSLYSYPIIGLIVFVMSGHLYYVFPQVLLLFSFLDSVYRFPTLFDYAFTYDSTGKQSALPICNPCLVLYAILKHPLRYGLPLISNALTTAYALISYPLFPLWSVSLAIVPFFVYVLTLPLTHPCVHVDGGTVLQADSTIRSASSRGRFSRRVSENG